MPECEEAYTNREEKEETEMKVLKKITDFVSRYMAAIVPKYFWKLLET